TEVVSALRLPSPRSGGEGQRKADSLTKPLNQRLGTRPASRCSLSLLASSEKYAVEPARFTSRRHPRQPTRTTAPGRMRRTTCAAFGTSLKEWIHRSTDAATVEWVSSSRSR